MRSVHTLASVQSHLWGTSLPCLAFGTPGSLICDCVSFTLPPSCPPWLHGHYPLRSYYGALTPARLLPAPGQVSLITECAFPDIPSPTTPCAPVSRQCSLLRAGLTSDSPCRAVGGSSDFARCSQSRQSHKAVSSLCRGRCGPSVLRTVLSFPVALHALSPGRSYFQLVAGSTATEGLPPSHTRSFSSARARRLAAAFGNRDRVSRTPRRFALHTARAMQTGLERARASAAFLAARWGRRPFNAARSPKLLAGFAGTPRHIH